MVVEKSEGVSIGDKRAFQVALLLALAYATTIGGMSTIIGTPPNVLLAGFIEETYGMQIAFFDWMLIGLPLHWCCSPWGGLFSHGSPLPLLFRRVPKAAGRYTKNA